MRDADGHVLYVGKSADLARRVGGYFRGSQETPARLQALGKRIHEFEYELVGSEIEALLLEHRLITELTPELNTQRRIAEGASRYAAPLTPRVVIAPSAARRRVELFFFGGGREADQLRVDPRRPPRRVLAGLVAHYRDQRRGPGSNPRLTRWGRVGTEICCRYFSRYRDALQWMELPAGGAIGQFLATLLDVVRLVAEKSPEPGEFRLTED